LGEIWRRSQQERLDLAQRLAASPESNADNYYRLGGASQVILGSPAHAHRRDLLDGRPNLLYRRLASGRVLEFDSADFSVRTLKDAA
jgi:hypothetical protein